MKTVANFKYLRSILERDRKNDKEINESARVFLRNAGNLVWSTSEM